MLKHKQLTKDLKIFTALICCNGYDSGKKMQEYLWEIYNNVEGIAFTLVDLSQFAFEAQKMLRRKKYDFLIIDAYTPNDDTNIQTIECAHQYNSEIKIMVLSSILTDEIKEWKKAEIIKSLQLVPFQKMPFLLNVKKTLIEEETEEEIILTTTDRKENREELDVLL